MRLGIVIGSADISGGTNVIFQHALFAVENGWDVTLIHILPLHESQKSWHPALKFLRIVTPDVAREECFDLLLGTWWPTVYRMPEIPARQYAYFVQSVESWFVPDSDRGIRQEIDATYLPPFPIVTEAGWICDYLRKRFGRVSFLAPNGIHKGMFQAEGPVVSPRRPNRLRVLVEGPLRVDFKNVPRTIELVKRAKPDEIWLLTHEPAGWYPGVDRVFSRLPIDQVSAVYRSCDLLVKLSYVEGMFGPPLEIFHCGGTAIVYDVTGHEEYIRHNVNGIVVQTGDEEGVVAAIKNLKQNPDFLASLKLGALFTASSWPSWELSSPQFLAVLREFTFLPKVTPEMLRVALSARPSPNRGARSLWRRRLRSIGRRAVECIPRLDVFLSTWIIPLYCCLVLSGQKNRGKRTKSCSLPDGIVDRFRSLG